MEKEIKQIIFYCNSQEYPNDLSKIIIENYLFLVTKNKMVAIQNHLLCIKKKKYMITLFYDVSHLRRVILNLQEKVHTDFKTGVLSFEGFMENLYSIIDNPPNDKQLILIMCDLDNFKSINDNYGHIAGDKILKYISGVLKIVFCEGELIARYGGDEFSLAVKTNDTKKLCNKMKQVQKQVKSLSQLFDIKLNVSFGITKYNSKLTLHENLDNADKALYYGKKCGRGQIISFDSVYDINET